VPREAPTPFSAANVPLGAQDAAEDEIAAENPPRWGVRAVASPAWFSAANVPLGAQDAAEDEIAAENLRVERRSEIAAENRPRAGVRA
jgi:hypothetical protein